MSNALAARQVFAQSAPAAAPSGGDKAADGIVHARKWDVGDGLELV